MPVAVNTNIHGHTDMVTAIKKLQTFLGLPVNTSIDNRAIQTRIIAIQTHLQTLGKFSAGSINKAIDDQKLAAAIIAVQVAGNT